MSFNHDSAADSVVEKARTSPRCNRDCQLVTPKQAYEFPPPPRRFHECVTNLA